LLLPPITIDCSHEYAGWAGTVSISASTSHVIINDIAASLAAAGIHRLLTEQIGRMGQQKSST
jgi:creatinine amidohydrolase